MRPTSAMPCECTRAGYALHVPRRRNIDRLQSEIEELFADLWQVPRSVGLRGGFRPLVDCYRTEDPAALTVVVDLAGVDPSALQVDIGDRELLITGERPPPRDPERRYQRMEIEYGRFERRVELTEPIDTEAAGAAYHAGVLTITLPLARRRPTREPVTIAIVRSADP
jgi:HSP20 family molecular chaperone IbpA